MAGGGGGGEICDELQVASQFGGRRGEEQEYSKSLQATETRDRGWH